MPSMYNLQMYGCTFQICQFYFISDVATEMTFDIIMISELKERQAEVQLRRSPNELMLNDKNLSVPFFTSGLWLLQASYGGGAVELPAEVHSRICPFTCLFNEKIRIRNDEAVFWKRSR